METLLLEIGAEEIPAGYIEPALKAMETTLLKKLDSARIDHGSAKTYGTPRRLAVMVSAVAPKQTALTTEVVGPPEKVAFDSQGKPTVAAEKFAEKVGLPLAKIRVKDTKKGRYLCAQKKERGVATQKLLKEILPDVILSTPFPKKMRWADLPIEFARPIHYVLALYGSNVVTFPLGNVKSGRTTRGHYFMSSGKIKIAEPREYLPRLKKARVVAEIDRRKEMVRKEVEKAARKGGGAVLPDEELMDIVTNLVEYPIPVVGRFETKFLDLPSEILITAMREHQKYFAVIDKEGNLMPCFIAVNNTRTKDLKLAAAGHEKVIRARLEDGRFFYQTDLKDTFDQWIESLKGVIFQAKLGTMHEKVMRTRKVAEFLADLSGQSAGARKKVSRAALLCKADLVSEVVGEFPKLQGLMGRVYATVRGEAKDVAAAIEEHYRPLRSGGALPKHKISATLAIADKIDSICGFFSVGLTPTGAADPYALRRQGIGIVQIMLNQRFDFSLREMIKKSTSLFSKKAVVSKAKTVDQVYTFIQNRISQMLVEEGFSKDVVAAVVDVSVDNIPTVWSRVRALQKLKSDPDFETLAAAFKRVVNILKQAKITGARKVNEKLFESKSEAALYAACQKVSGSVSKQLDKGAYSKALREIASLRYAVDTFFEDVMVLADNRKLRDNRLALLSSVSDVFGQFADFSKLSI